MSSPRYRDPFESLKKFLKPCPPVYWLLCTGSNEHRVLKAFACLIYGLILGLAFYELIIIDLDFTQNAAFIVGSIICLMLAFGLALSVQIRCIILLSFPNMAGKVGRSVLKVFILAFLLAGPIENLTVNGKEVARVFACSTSLTYNLTKTRFELMFKPFTEALFGMKTDANELKDTMRAIKDVSAPLTGEIEDDKEMKKLKEENDYLDSLNKDTKRSALLETKYSSKGEAIEAAKFEQNYLHKIEMRCQDQFTRAALRCRAMFSKAYDSCYEAVTWTAAWLLCWPMKLSFVCNIAEALGGQGRCDPEKDIDPGFGSGYGYLKTSQDFLSKNFKNVRLQFKIPKVKQIDKVLDAKDSAQALLHSVETKKYIIDIILNVIKRLLAFMFLKILIESQNYHDKYLRDIEFDNIYISGYFRKIDAKRKKKGQYTILPLKKIEKKKLVDPKSSTPLKQEREQLFKGTIILLLEMVTATIFVILDSLFFEALDLVRRHGKIDYVQTGHHDLYLEVIGTGMIASLLRSIVSGFNVKKRIRIETSNEHCLPKPTKLPRYYLYKIYFTYLGIWILMCLQAYIQRLRRLICAYFYRKREKRRILYLYNQTLRRRIGFFKFMKNKVKKLARQRRLQMDFNVFQVLRIKYPQYCDFLRWFSIARRKCLVCEEPEPRKNSTFVECSNERCYSIYCLECWVDLGSKCLACAAEDEDSSGFEESSDFDSD